MTRIVALLRGINLGPKRRIAMADLRELLAEAGFEDPRTHLQSGNVIVGTRKRPDTVARELERSLSKRFGFDVDVVARTAAELAAIVAHDPFAGVATDPKRYGVAFLDAEPDPKRLEQLLARDFSPELLHAHGRELYTWHPDGFQRSQLFRAVGDQQLARGATMRNWNTVLALNELASAPAGP
jgi:uncharacterized protein (DUF1697 family)